MILLGDDLYDVPIAKMILERHDAAVDLGARATVAYLGVNQIGEIDRGGFPR